LALSVEGEPAVPPPAAEEREPSHAEHEERDLRRLRDRVALANRAREARRVPVARTAPGRVRAGRAERPAGEGVHPGLRPARVCVAVRLGARPVSRGRGRAFTHLVARGVRERWAGERADE
jgi:hypothetical protein